MHRHLFVNKKTNRVVLFITGLDHNRSIECFVGYFNEDKSFILFHSEVKPALYYSYKEDSYVKRYEYWLHGKQLEKTDWQIALRRYHGAYT